MQTYDNVKFNPGAESPKFHFARNCFTFILLVALLSVALAYLPIYAIVPPNSFTIVRTLNNSFNLYNTPGKHLIGFYHGAVNVPFHTTRTCSSSVFFNDGGSANFKFTLNYSTTLPTTPQQTTEIYLNTLNHNTQKQLDLTTHIACARAAYSMSTLESFTTKRHTLLSTIDSTLSTKHFDNVTLTSQLIDITYDQHAHQLINNFIACRIMSNM